MISSGVPDPLELLQGLVLVSLWPFCAGLQRCTSCGGFQLSLGLVSFIWSGIMS